MSLCSVFAKTPTLMPNKVFSHGGGGGGEGSTGAKSLYIWALRSSTLAIASMTLWSCAARLLFGVLEA